MRGVQSDSCVVQVVGVGGDSAGVVLERYK